MVDSSAKVSITIGTFVYEFETAFSTALAILLEPRMYSSSDLMRQATRVIDRGAVIKDRYGYATEHVEHAQLLHDAYTKAQAALVYKEPL